MSTKKDTRKRIKNPYTGRLILADGQTAKNVKKHISSLKEESLLHAKGEGKYKKVSDKSFCGSAGKAPKYTFPVTSEKRCRAALSYARDAPNPEGIRRCALKIAREKGWSCGTSSTKVEREHLKPSRGSKQKKRTTKNLRKR